MIQAARRAIVGLHRRLLPTRPEIGWTPYLWLFYLSFYLGRWAFQPPTARELAWTGPALVAFLVLYFNGFWQTGRRLLVNMAGIVAIGVLLTALNPGALTFFIYASGFAGYIGTTRQGWWSIGAIVTAAVATALGLGMSGFWLVLTCVLVVMIGSVNIYFAEVGRKNEALRRSQEEVERLASVAERERIARDLHDLLGHTLTVITVKAELARKLSERGDPRASAEVADVERISREALGQVRSAVAGFADVGLAGELKRARLVFEAKGVELDADVPELDLDPRRETALAMVLREALTNVVRHSRASTCRVRLARGSSAVELVVEDDGRGSRGAASTGHGLESMRQRLAALGGRLDVDTRPGDGFRVTAAVPVEPPPSARRSPALDLAGGASGPELEPEPA